MSIVKTTAIYPEVKIHCHFLIPAWPRSLRDISTSKPSVWCLAPPNIITTLYGKRTMRVLSPALQSIEEVVRSFERWILELKVTAMNNSIRCTCNNLSSIWLICDQMQISGRYKFSISLVIYIEELESRRLYLPDFFTWRYRWHYPLRTKFTNF